MSFEKILFYGIIIVGALLLIGLTYYRIDWARHPEKYQDLVEQAENVPVGHLANRHRQSIISSGCSACAHAQSRAYTDKDCAQ